MLREYSGYITSDSPVVYYNQYLESLRPGLGNIGLLTKGLEIFFPISPGILLMWYDGGIYKVGDKREKVIQMRKPADIDGLNGLQFISADQNLYFSPETPEDYVRSLASRYQRARNLYRSIVNEYEGVSHPNRVLIHTRPPEIRCDLNLSFVKLHRRVRRVTLGTKVALPRDEEMQGLLSDFADLVSQRQLNWSDFPLFLIERGKLRLPLARRSSQDEQQGEDKG